MLKLKYPYTVREEKALRVLNEILKDGRLALLADGNVHRVSPEFELGILEEGQFVRHAFLGQVDRRELE